MKAKDFKVAPVLTGCKAEKPQSRKHARRLLAVFTAFLTVSAAVISAQPNEIPPLGGVEIYYPPIASISNFQRIMDSWFAEKMDIKMIHNYPVTIKTPDGNISFIADGCNPKKKIAYEWTYYYYHEKPEVVDASTNLSKKEYGLIKEYRIGSWYIFTYDCYDEFDLENKLVQFERVLKEKNKP